MAFGYRLLALVVTIVLIGGCMSSGSKKATPPPKVYVTPCNVAAKGVQIKVNAGVLKVDVVKPELVSLLVDNFKSPAGESMLATYVLECHWGDNVGERRDYYYCNGKYKAPELDEAQVITRFLWKEFKIGFSVEEHNIGTWVDSTGKEHKEGSVYYLTSKTVDASCYVA